MSSNTYSKKLRLNQTSDITSLIERICQDNNINNYFASISVSISYIIDMMKHEFRNEESFVMDFHFEQCVGGVAFGLLCQKPVFEEKRFGMDLHNRPEDCVVSSLTDKIIILSQGKGVELQFYVNGIESELLSNRQKGLKSYVENKAQY